MVPDQRIKGRSTAAFSAIGPDACNGASRSLFFRYVDKSMQAFQKLFTLIN